MPLVVETPDTHLPERQYALRVVLGEFLGVEFEHAIGPGGIVRIRADDGRCIEMPDALFGGPSSGWLSAACLPSEPLGRAHVDEPLSAAVVEAELPIVFGGSGRLVDKRDASTTVLDLDVLGTAFFMLSRMEEVIRPERDTHGRFPASSSIGAREGFVTRPIVDEYVGILWSCMHELWPGLERKQPEFSVFSTHDVDFGLEYSGMPHWQIARRFANRALRGDLSGARRAVSEWSAVRRCGITADPWYTFDFIMSSAEDAGWPCSFYVMPDVAAGHEEQHWYSLRDPDMRAVLAHIGERGHEIGLHSSYESHLDGDLLCRELSYLRATCAEVGVDQSAWGGRAHYLRWDASTSARLWSDAGLTYDSTLAFAELPGFRCGVCRPFPLFDLAARAELPLWERPLILMDGSLIAEEYLGLAPDDAHAHVLELRERCRIVGGEFVILWHHPALSTPAHQDLYAAALTGR